MAPSAHGVGDRGRGRRVRDRPLARQRHRRQLHTGAEQRAEQRGHRHGAGLRCPRLDGGDRWAQLPARQDGGPRAVPSRARAELDAVLPHDRRPQGRRPAVHDRGPALLLHRRLVRHGDPHRTAEPYQPRVRTRDLHRAGLPARDDDDDDGVLGRGGAAGQLAHPPHDRRPADGLPEGRGVLVLDLRRRVPRHPDRSVPRRLPDGLDRLRARCRPKPPAG